MCVHEERKREGIFNFVLLACLFVIREDLTCLPNLESESSIPNLFANQALFCGYYMTPLPKTFPSN